MAQRMAACKFQDTETIGHCYSDKGFSLEAFASQFAPSNCLMIRRLIVPESRHRALTL